LVCHIYYGYSIEMTKQVKMVNTKVE